MKQTSILSILALSATAAAVPAARSIPSSPPAILPRAIVNHDSLNPVPQRVANTPAGKAMALFNPALHIAHGCQPYPAVNDQGDTSAGLQDTGNVDAGCRDTAKAQTYARAGVVDGKSAIMYSWYMPKDQPNAGNVAGGHRHEFENVVLFVDTFDAATPKIVSAAASGHGKYKKTATPQRSGNTVQVEYFTTFPLNHELQFTNTVGVTHAISDWDAMPQAAKDAISQDVFGKASCPFKDGSFESNVRNAAL